MRFWKCCVNAQGKETLYKNHLKNNFRADWGAYLSTESDTPSNQDNISKSSISRQLLRFSIQRDWHVMKLEADASTMHDFQDPISRWMISKPSKRYRPHQTNATFVQFRRNLVVHWWLKTHQSLGIPAIVMEWSIVCICLRSNDPEEKGWSYRTYQKCTEVCESGWHP